MSLHRRKFSKEQKLEIVNESLNPAANVEEMALHYKVHVNTIYKWRSEYMKYDSASFPGNGNKIMSAEEREIARLKQQLKEVELEKEILKKALGIFSSPDRKNLLL
jgi:transposase